MSQLSIGQKLNGLFVNDFMLKVYNQNFADESWKNEKNFFTFFSMDNYDKYGIEKKYSGYSTKNLFRLYPLDEFNGYAKLAISDPKVPIYYYRWRIHHARFTAGCAYGPILERDDINSPAKIFSPAPTVSRAGKFPRNLAEWFKQMIGLSPQGVFISNRQTRNVSTVLKCIKTKILYVMYSHFAEPVDLSEFESTLNWLSHKLFGIVALHYNDSTHWLETAPKEDDCVICYDPSPVRLKVCHHYVCRSCWACDQMTKCPMCRRVVGEGLVEFPMEMIPINPVVWKSDY